MKKYRLFLLIIFFISAGSFFQQATAQEKTKDDKKKEEMMQKSIDKQKKALTDQKKGLSEDEQALKEQIEESDNSINEANEELENANLDRMKILRSMPRGNRSFSVGEPFVWSSSDMSPLWGHGMMGDEEGTTWDFSKSIKDNTFSRDYTFDVEKSAKSVVMSVVGECKSGEIRIKIVMPNGKNYSDILIDESGDLNWRKSFTISDTENQEKAGDWKFQISSAKATGFFKISLKAY